MPRLECPAQLSHQLILPGRKSHPLAETSPALATGCLTHVPGAPGASATASCGPRCVTAISKCVQIPDSTPKASSRNMLTKMEKKSGKTQRCCCACARVSVCVCVPFASYISSLFIKSINITGLNITTLCFKHVIKSFITFYIESHIS